ncbi:MAG: DUF917 domain-containing protein [Nitrososphaerota archaeon]|nr:DUF917 domain-containing protein [Candidatus Calditenuaceae archaeon]MDW8073874.1 DUF917 domain-containing protein [Nitrososphaerota archaeon]
MRLLDEQSIEDIAVGATILGTGGGGDPYIGKLMAIDAVLEHGPVKLIEPCDVDDDALVIPVAMMGAPTVLVEKIPRGDEIFEAFGALERRFGRKAVATMSIEAGGVNSTIPLAVAARLGMPVVDCDGMGRAFPEIQMVVPHLYGVKATPMAMADEKGNFVMLETIDNFWTEKISRAVTVVMGGSAIIALYAMTGKQLKEATVYGSLTLAETIGRTLREAKQAKKNPVKELLKLVRGYELFRGKIIDVVRRTVAGFARGEARFEGIDDYAGHELIIQFQNENLVAIKDGRIIATVPDLITVLEIETGLPITTEGLRYGYRVTVIGIPCNPKWRTPKALEVVGPRYFGYDIDYVPIEERVKEVIG